MVGEKYKLVDCCDCSARFGSVVRKLGSHPRRCPDCQQRAEAARHKVRGRKPLAASLSCLCCGGAFTPASPLRTTCSTDCKNRIGMRRRRGQPLDDASFAAWKRPPRLSAADLSIRAISRRHAKAMKALDAVQPWPFMACVGCAGPLPAARSPHLQFCRGCLQDKRISERKERKAAIRGATTERVSVLDILRRDKWTCQNCRCRTPQAKRGGYDDDAPELDHIIALANGGAHASWNLQCLCRRCNLMKSDAGQLALL